MLQRSLQVSDFSLVSLDEFQLTHSLNPLKPSPLEGRVRLDPAPTGTEDDASGVEGQWKTAAWRVVSGPGLV